MSPLLAETGTSITVDDRHPARMLACTFQHMLRSPALLGFLFGLTVIAVGFLADPPDATGWIILVGLLGGWLFAEIARR